MSDHDWKNDLNASIEALIQGTQPLPVTEASPKSAGGASAAVSAKAPVADAPRPPARPAQAAPVQPGKAAESPVASITPAGSGSLLDRLKKQADAKRDSDARQQTDAEARVQAVGTALSDVFSYLRELCQQLNVIKQTWPHPMFITDSLSFSDLHWEEGRADYRRRVGPEENQPMERVSLRFKLAGPKPVEIERENPHMDNLRKVLIAQTVPHQLNEIRNSKGYTERGKFTITPEIRAGMLFVGNFDTGEISLKVLNLPRLGSSEYLVPVSQLGPATLEEIALLAVGESSKFFLHFKRVS